MEDVDWVRFFSFMTRIPLLQGLGDTMSGRIISTILVVFLVCYGGLPAHAEGKKPAAVVITPFDSNAAGKYSHLKDSLRNMLSSRLAARDGIQILDYSLSQKDVDEMRAAKKQDLAKGLFGRLHADYLATGAIYSTAGGLHLQITLYTESAEGSPLKFTMLAENDERILSSLDQLAQEIGDKVTGTPAMPMTENAASGEGGKQTAPAGSEGMAGFQTAHPDRLYKKGIYAGGGIVGGENAGTQVSAKGVRKSSPLSMQMVSMAVGDLDGDGVDEIVLAADGELQIYHYREGRFVQFAKTPISQKLKVHALNLADLDKTGKKKIYLSATDENTISSLIAEWSKDHGLHIVHKNMRWYIRPMEIPGEGMVLAGQEKGPDDNTLVFPGIYRLKMEKGSDVPKKGQQLSLPDQVNLFDFVFADLKGDGGVETVVIDKNEKMLVYDQNKALIWVSNDEYGGSKNYLGSRYFTSNMTKNKIFVPARLLAVDLNNDKKQEIIISRNKRDTYSFFANFRSYNGGSISCLAWTGAAMSELWHTNQLPGLIADYSFNMGASRKKGSSQSAAMEAGGETAKQPATLFVGQIPESAIYNLLIPAKDETVLFSYQLDFMDESGKK
jgi:hypothetical protein